MLLLDGVDIDAGGCRVTGQFPHRWGKNFNFDLRGHLFGQKTEEPTKPKPDSDTPLPPNPDPDDEDEDDRYAVWMGCTICYIFLTDALYDALSEKLLGPNYSLDLNDVAVAELILQAMNDNDGCEKVGDLEFLESYLESKGEFHCPQTWA